MKSESVCWDCKHCFCEEAFKGGPEYMDCNESSEQFMMPEGCWYYEERKECDD